MEKIKPSVQVVNLLPLYRTTLKAFADMMLKMVHMMGLILQWTQNEEKGENAGLPAFSPFPTTFFKWHSSQGP